MGAVGVAQARLGEIPRGPGALRAAAGVAGQGPGGAEQVLDEGAEIGLDRQRCRGPARQLRGVDVDADQVGGQGEAAILVHVAIGRPQLGPERQHQV